MSRFNRDLKLKPGIGQKTDTRGLTTSSRASGRVGQSALQNLEHCPLSIWRYRNVKVMKSWGQF